MDQLSLMIYPCYIDSKTELDDGRRIGIADCVDTPRLSEIMTAVEHLGFTATLNERKMHPRDFWHPGRVVVKFFAEQPDGKKLPIHSTITKRKQLYRAVAKEINTIRAGSHAKAKKGK